jgi:hypothetical protein
VFKDRGGFDVIVGNPPWVSINFELEPVLSEHDPRVIVHKYSSLQVREEIKKLTRTNLSFTNILIQEWVMMDCTMHFVNAKQNFPLNDSSKSNLHKLVVESSINAGKHVGIVIDKGIFDDPNGGKLRSAIFNRLKYIFRFRNELKLFNEVGNAKKFEILILSNSKTINFDQIANLFHPKTIDSAYSNVDNKIFGVIDENGNWELNGNNHRIIKITDNELAAINQIFEQGNCSITESRLPNLHNNQHLNILEKINRYPRKLRELREEIVATQMLNETTSVNQGIIKRDVGYVDSENLILSGPHYYVGTPYFKNPNQNCENHRDYSNIMLEDIVNGFLPRTVYRYIVDDKMGHDGYSHIHRRRGINSNERTLIGTIIPPKRSHLYTGYSMYFKNEKDMLMFSSATLTILYDFAIRVTGKEDLLFNSIDYLPVLFFDDPMTPHLIYRVLRLTCLNKEYAELWNKYNNYFIDNNVSNDLINISGWSENVPITSFYKRRKAIIEIEVIVAIMMNISLQDLISIYSTEFSVFKTNEEDTWYDQKGKIVFTINKGLSGVGLDRPEWEKITEEVNPMQRKLKDGDTYEHTITKSELYQGQKITYYSPFDKCDRVEDYKVAWAHFEKLFKEKN